MIKPEQKRKFNINFQNWSLIIESCKLFFTAISEAVSETVKVYIIESETLRFVFLILDLKDYDLKLKYSYIIFSRWKIMRHQFWKKKYPS